MSPLAAARNRRPALAGLRLFSLATLLFFEVSFLMCALPAQAADPHGGRGVQGVVSKVTDGDSLWLTPAGKPPIEVRLRDIDAPESCQPWGNDARTALAELALNKVATLQTSGRDTYGRTVGVLMIDDLNVAKFLVENGHAWSTRSRWDQGPLVKEEKMARALSRGLHGTPGAVKPVDFRRAHGPCGVGEAAATAGVSLPATASARVATQVATSGTFRCDGRTHCSQMTSCEEAKYFLANCSNVKMDGGSRNGIPCEKQWCNR